MPHVLPYVEWTIPSCSMQNNTVDNVNICYSAHLTNVLYLFFFVCLSDVRMILFYLIATWVLSLIAEVLQPSGEIAKIINYADYFFAGLNLVPILRLSMLK